ncbi:hypothetical protein [Sphingomonas abaci]|uniref:NOL1/NOP2/fmu family ribosome biogenesis protein n=1 Tax=Sphingomonas abaci TaxID=237611 RepID=A0A7W7AN70_9SPHN|nr:hypothetical protein [Sphingomonas abaci]MBB4619976.1 NOL1/NOP2/fmu family ribosome biogenesis protein [Sphingomonas abaci]
MVTRAELATTIRVAIAVAPPYVKKTLELQHASAREMLVDDLVSRIMGSPESETVILQPDLAGFGTGSKPGVWDVDEPHPHPELRKR